MSEPYHWTHSAVMCYVRGGVCRGCIYERLHIKCRMKSALLEIVRRYGKPQGVKEKTVIEDEFRHENE